jgi:hypothetical protein
MTKENSKSNFIGFSKFLSNPWTIGIVLILGGLGSFSKSIIGGILYLIAGFITIPPLRLLIIQKSNVNILSNKYAVIALVVLLGIVGGLFVSMGEKAKALKNFEKDKPSIISQVQLNIDSGKYEEAKRTINRYLIISPKDQNLNELNSTLYSAWAPALKLEIQKEISENSFTKAANLINLVKVNIKNDPDLPDIEKYFAEEKSKYESILKAQKEKEEAARRIISACSSDYTKCPNNEDLINNYSGMPGAKAACQIEAEKLTKWGSPQWGWSKFGTFYTGTDYVSSGVIRIVDNNVKFQNGYGAYGKVQIECHYDLKSKQIDAIFAR